MKAPRFSVTILADNELPETQPKAKLAAEHGFSAWIESAPGEPVFRVLFDVGRGALFANADALGICLSEVSDIVLSHGHYDHTDSLPGLLSLNPAVRIHASADIFREHWSAKTGTLRPIGLSAENRALLAGPSFFRPFRGEGFIPRTVFRLTEGIPRNHPLEKPSPLLFADPKGTVPDPIGEELALWAETEQGLVILTGCCHAGLINTCERIRAVSGEKRIRAVIGGFHLAGVGEKRLEAVARYLRETGVSLVVPCHCTGAAETEWLSARLGTTVQKGYCGMKLEF